MSSELSITQSGIVLRGLPNNPHKATIELAHEGHKGIKKTNHFYRKMYDSLVLVTW